MSLGRSITSRRYEFEMYEDDLIRVSPNHPASQYPS